MGGAPDQAWAPPRPGGSGGGSAGPGQSFRRTEWQNKVMRVSFEERGIQYHLQAHRFVS